MMANRELSVVPITPRDVQQVIATLEDALAEAKAGQIDGIVLVTHSPNRTWRGRWNGIDYPSAMGYLSRVIWKLNQAWDEG